MRSSIRQTNSCVNFRFLINEIRVFYFEFCLNCKTRKSCNVLTRSRSHNKHALFDEVISRKICTYCIFLFHYERMLFTEKCSIKNFKFFFFCIYKKKGFVMTTRCFLNLTLTCASFLLKKKFTLRTIDKKSEINFIYVYFLKYLPFQNRSK